MFEREPHVEETYTTWKGFQKMHELTVISCCDSPSLSTPVESYGIYIEGPDGSCGVPLNQLDSHGDASIKKLALDTIPDPDHQSANITFLVSVTPLLCEHELTRISSDCTLYGSRLSFPIFTMKPVTQLITSAALGSGLKMPSLMIKSEMRRGYICADDC
ncbi:hypothetical protein AKJ16_DCAP12393 [Drosera capensis]